MSKTGKGKAVQWGHGAKRGFLFDFETIFFRLAEKEAQCGGGGGGKSKREHDAPVRRDPG